MIRNAVLGMGFLWLLSCQPSPHTTPSPRGVHSQQTAALIGGAPDTRHPAIGALLANLRIYCTGTLLTRRLVLTAAHCIESARREQGRGARLQFRVDIPTDDAFQVRYYDVGSMHMHPQYSGSDAGSKNQNDIGVVLLSQDVLDVTPLPIYTRSVHSGWIGRQILFWGYGLLQTQPNTVSAGKKHHLSLTMREVQQDRFQFQDKDKSICSGDSGGPALYEIDSVLRIVGVNSYVVGGKRGTQPLCDGSGFAFRVDAYFTWLLPYLVQTGWKCADAQDCSACGSCQMSTGACTPNPVASDKSLCQPCRADSDCSKLGALCSVTPQGKRCTQPCDASSCCPQGYSCQFIGQGIKQCFPSDGTCPPVSCQADTDCGPGERCNNGSCAPKVVATAADRCRPCAQDSDCQSGHCEAFPDGRRCVQPCEGDVFCPAGDTCRLVEGARLCIPSNGQCPCVTARDCHDGYLCRDGACQQGIGGKHGDECDDQNPCASEHLCLGAGKGTCVAICPGTYPPGTPGSLCDGKQCLHNSRCYGVSGKSVCLLSCKDTGDCPFGGSCQAISGLSLCTCSQDSDCRQGSGCNIETVGSFGVCAPRSSGNICPSGTSCQLSVASTYLCQADGARGAGGSCASGETCQWGLRCINRSGGAVCARDCSRDGACQPEGGACTQVPGASLCFCQDDKGCAPEHICHREDGDNNGICIKARCQSDSDCQGQRCQAGRCTSATPEPPSPEPTAPDEAAPADAGPTETAPEPPSSGCGCHSAPPQPKGMWWLGGLLLAWLQWRKHRASEASS